MSDDLKQKYNTILERLKKADAWFETASHDEQLKQHDAYRQLVVDIGNAENALRAAGIPFTLSELRNGFEVTS